MESFIQDHLEFFIEVKFHVYGFKLRELLLQCINAKFSQCLCHYLPHVKHLHVIRTVEQNVTFVLISYQLQDYYLC